MSETDHQRISQSLDRLYELAGGGYRLYRCGEGQTGVIMHPRQCGEFEIRLNMAASSGAYFKFENHTGNMILPVALLNPKFVQSMLRRKTNSGFG